ncbi:MAG: magnesium chelatase [Planctomycetes bacterium]|nr:magnesium chelatase [Planctomycetota bacterium]MCL4729076.1 magnesium chelatase [Planctomycetota bacterium]
MSTRPATRGALVRAGWRPRTVKDELRQNLMARMKSGATLFDGIVGYDRTVIPQVVNALLARHNIILLGLRGQAKTRLLRGLTGLLDEYIPVIKGSELNDDPLNPQSKRARELVARHGDDIEIEWLHRDARYNEKLATPDVSIADLIGDVDPIKAATRKLTFADEEVIHFGIIPRTNRGIFAINELPDLQPRIQVGLLNMLEEKDIQIRGFPVRIPLDILLCFSANPEDYTNRGSIITPLKDRIESQILTHYPLNLSDARRITDQESWVSRPGAPTVRVPEFLREAIEQIAFEARKSEFVDQASGVSARMTIAVYENVLSNAERRCLIAGQSETMLRVVDLGAAIPAMSGKLELVYEGEQEGAHKVAAKIIGAALRAVFETRFPGVYALRARQGRKQKESAPQREEGPYKPVIDWFARGRRLELTDEMPDTAYGAALQSVPELETLTRQYLKDLPASHLHAGMEFLLEGLHQSSLLAKEDVDRGILYCDMLGALYESQD